MVNLSYNLSLTVGEAREVLGLDGTKNVIEAIKQLHPLLMRSEISLTKEGLITGNISKDPEVWSVLHRTRFPLPGWKCPWEDNCKDNCDACPGDGG